MRFQIVLALTVLVTLAGCSAIPFGEPTAQQEPAPIMLVNNASLTETFEVAVVDVGSHILATRSNNQTANYTVSQGSSTIVNPDTYPFTRIELPDSARIHGRYTLEPGDRKQLSIENVAPNQAIVVLVYDEPDGTYRAIKTLSCGGAILGYKVSPESGGPEDWTPSVHQCG